jgi:hypothetical protein
MPPIKTYAITVQGFPPALYSARSPSSARARCWRDYASTSDVPFRDFLKMSKIHRAENPPGIGERILVGGLPATRVIGFGQYVHYMRDDGDVIARAHPADVKPFPDATASAIAS